MNETKPIDVTCKTQGQMFEALKMLCGLIEGYPDLHNEPSIRACYTTASALLDQVDAEANQGFRIERLTDYPEKENHSEAMEQSYRRGYYQGYFTAIMDLEETGHSRKVVESHLYNELQKWRFDDPVDQIIFPPEIPE